MFLNYIEHFIVFSCLYTLDKLRLRADTLVSLWRQRQSNGTPSTEHVQEFSGDGNHGTNSGDNDSAISVSVRFSPWTSKMNGEGGTAFVYHAVFGIPLTVFSFSDYLNISLNRCI